MSNMSNLEKLTKQENILQKKKHNDLISEKYTKTCKYLNYVENLLILVSTGSGCVSVSVFASLVCLLLGFTSSVVGRKICAFTAGIKKYKLIIKKNKKIHDKIVLLGKDFILHITEVLISKPVIE